MARAQASLEYLMTYGLALLIIGGAISALTAQKPDIDVPNRCQVSGPFTCKTVVQNRSGGYVKLLLLSDSQRTLTLTGSTFNYREATTSCTISDTTLKVSETTTVTCGLPAAYSSFLKEKEKMTVDLEYKGLELAKIAEISIII